MVVYGNIRATRGETLAYLILYLRGPSGGLSINFYVFNNTNLTRTGFRSFMMRTLVVSGRYSPPLLLRGKVSQATSPTLQGRGVFLRTPGVHDGPIVSGMGGKPKPKTTPRARRSVTPPPSRPPPLSSHIIVTGSTFPRRAYICILIPAASLFTHMHATTLPKLAVLGGAPRPLPNSRFSAGFRPLVTVHADKKPLTYKVRLYFASIYRQNYTWSTFPHPRPPPLRVAAVIMVSRPALPFPSLPPRGGIHTTI